MFCCTIEKFKCFIKVGVLNNVAWFDNVLISYFRDRMRNKATHLKWRVNILSIIQSYEDINITKKLGSNFYTWSNFWLHKRKPFWLLLNKSYGTKFRKSSGTPTNVLFSSYKIPPWLWNKNHCNAYIMQLLCFASSAMRVRNSLSSWNLHAYIF